MDKFATGQQGSDSLFTRLSSAHRGRTVSIASLRQANSVRFTRELMRRVTIGAVTVLALSWVMSASAQGEYFKDRGLYMSLLLTGSEPSGPKPTSSTDLGGFTGLGLAGSIGYRWLPLRVELEYQGNTSGWIGGTEDYIAVRALTLNAIVEFQLLDWLGVYFGAGLGRANVTANFSTCLQPSGCPTPIVADTSGSASAQQLQLGVTLGSPKEWQWLLGFRRFTTGSLGLTYNQGQPFAVDNADANMSFVGLRVNF
jgi:opacity protein-like surface antigen